jgi:DNA-binding transcriptional ArsR family regulator
LKPFLDISKALSDESRVRALLALRGGELCLCQLIDLLELAPSTISKHLAILAQAGLVLCRKQGRWHYYRRPGESEAPPLVARALAWVDEALERSPVAREDRKRLKCICRKDIEEVSACYRS